ncbi:carbohydrate ABC transporter permease [Alkalicoccobacillus porphyridii]|uniref:Sugar ABC transporter permease n=1 Tax=Alkalicoccobacillus porphyridii TaxID=2597270 RepID=A0A554A151_9BACI|nr:sugar ABC transporter permease [Alkalicoccobacillus porphyridii]TSB47417.1 sugar ABC transporter permease [Alkalicoccobacillus porphyridii]
MKRSVSVVKLLVFVGIPMIPLIVFWFVPMAVSLWLSLTDWDYISPSYNMVGLDNYTTLLTSGAFYQALNNTFVFTIMTIIPTLVIGLLLALLLNRKLKGSTIFRAFLFSPWITPMVAMSIVWTWIFEPDLGLMNELLGWLNLPQPAWLQSSQFAIWAIIIVTVWKNAGWAMIFYSEALQRIPKDLYEVSHLEDTTAWQRLRTITLPMVSPTTLFLSIITTVDALQAYDQIQVMTQGGPSGSTRTLLYYYYQLAFEQFNMGQATAVATLLVAITGLISALQFRLTKKYVHY